MSEEENKATVRCFIEELRADLAAVDQMFGPGFKAHLPGGLVQADSEIFKGFASLLYKAFPDLHHTVERFVAENDLVAFRVTRKAPHAFPIWIRPYRCFAVQFRPN
jgi:predicted ester cyclase